MCGIAGIIDFKNINNNRDTILKNMIDTLKNRGPDAEGIYINNNLIFGHRRLIVVDPKGGNQPMIKKYNGYEYSICYNGELYNTEDIRKELSISGFTFDSYSDTEVLLTAYIFYGIDVLKKLNGIFAFALYDQKENRVLLARDHVGVKPLFYSIKDNEFNFASEIKALFKNPKIVPELDEDGLTELFSLGPAVSLGSGVFKGIKEVKPAEAIIITKDNIKKFDYWSLEAKVHTHSLNDTLDCTKNLLVDSVKRQLVGDVPLCTFLSGGLDSSAISAIATSELKKQNKVLTTYSIDYEDNDKYFKSNLFQPTSDSYWAAEMAKFIGSNHKNILLNHIDLVNALKNSTVARDLPGMADVDSSLYLSCREVRKDFVIALSGEGSDELFGGYPWFTRPELINSNTFPWSRFVSDRISILSPDLKRLKISEYSTNKYLETLNSVPHLDNESPEDYRMRELFVLNLKWFMVTLLNRKDRMSMANGLEVRVPFADYRIVEYAFNIPKDIKLLKGREKGLLRKSLEGMLPEDIIYRKKSPYPKTHNPIYTEYVCSEMERVLNTPSSPLLNLIDKNKFQEIVKTKGSSYKAPWYGQLMTGPQLIAYFLQINYWLESYNVKISLNN